MLNPLKYGVHGTKFKQQSKTKHDYKTILTFASFTNNLKFTKPQHDTNLILTYSVFFGHQKVTRCCYDL